MRYRELELVQCNSVKSSWHPDWGVVTFDRYIQFVDGIQWRLPKQGTCCQVQIQDVSSQQWGHKTLLSSFLCTHSTFLDLVSGFLHRVITEINKTSLHYSYTWHFLQSTTMAASVSTSYKINGAPFMTWRLYSPQYRSAAIENCVSSRGS